MALSLIQALSDLPLAFVDVETTGASADFGHRIIEVGIVRVERGLKVAEYQQLIDPLRRVSAGVTALTGITQEMVTGQPCFQAHQPPAPPMPSNITARPSNIGWRQIGRPDERRIAPLRLRRS